MTRYSLAIPLMFLAACQVSQPSAPALDSRVIRLLEISHAWIDQPRCFYEQIGESTNELFIYLDCRSPNHQQGTNGPAVVRLAEDGTPVRLLKPGDGSQHQIDIAQMFPTSAQEMLSSRNLVELQQRVQSLHAR